MVMTHRILQLLGCSNGASSSQPYFRATLTLGAMPRACDVCDQEA